MVSCRAQLHPCQRLTCPRNATDILLKDAWGKRKLKDHVSRFRKTARVMIGGAAMAASWRRGFLLGFRHLARSRHSEKMNCCRSKGPHLFIASVDASRSPITDSYHCQSISDECIRLPFGLFQSSPYHRACRLCGDLGYLHIFEVRNDIFGLASRCCGCDGLVITVLVGIIPCRQVSVQKSSSPRFEDISVLPSNPSLLKIHL